MTSTEKSACQNDSSSQMPLAERNPAKRFLNDYSADQIKEALLTTEQLTNSLEELIATGEAVFEFIRQSEMDLPAKNAFYRLEKQFNFYKNLLLQ